MANPESTPKDEPNLHQTLRQLGRYGFSQTGTAALQKMADRIDADLDQLQSQAVQLKDQVERGLEDGDPNVFDMLKKKMQHLRGEIEDLTTKQQRVRNTLEHQYMSAGMARLVGSPRRVAIMEGFVLILIVLVLGLLAYEYIQPDEQARPGWLSSNNIFWIDVVCCLVFQVEFFMRRSCARCKRWFWKNHWIDFFTSIPLPGEAQLARFGRVARVARFARLLRFTRIIRAMRVFLLLWRGMDKLQDTMDVKLMKRSLKWGLIFMLLGGLLVFQLERNMAETGNDVTSVGGGIWWSFTTLVTGGFGDIHNPVTAPGRLLTVMLVITGMILVGVFTATLTSLYVGEESEELQRYQDEMNSRLNRMEETIQQLARQLPAPPEE